MNRYLVATLAAMLFLGWSGEVSARQTQLGFDVTALGLMPLGDHERIAGPGLGVLAGVEGEAAPGFGLTLRGGYISQMTRGDYTRAMVPILGGVKLTTYSSNLYLAGEAGRVSIRDEYTGPSATPGSDTRTSKTAWGVGIGSASDRLDLRLSFHVWNTDRMSESMTIGISLGFLIVGS